MKRSLLVAALARSGGGGLLPETLAYKLRVEADGGEVIDIDWVNEFYKSVKYSNSLSLGYIAISASAGIKKDVSNLVSKFYNLIPDGHDVIQTTSSKFGTFIASDSDVGNKPCAQIVDDEYYIDNITLKGFINVYVGGFYTTPPLFEHGANASSDPGFAMYGSNNHSAILRRSSSLFNVGSSNWMINSNSLFKVIFSDLHYITLKDYGALDIAAKINSSFDTDVVKNYHLFSRNKTSHFGTGKFTYNFLFKKLSREQDYVITRFLKTGKFKTNSKLVNLFSDGHSMIYTNGVSTDYNAIDLLSFNLDEYDKLNTFAVYNVGGQTITQMSNDYVAQIRPLYDSSKINILIVWGGVNDFGLELGTTKETIYQRLKDYCLLAKSDGFKAIPATMTPQSYAAYSGRTDFENERIWFNNQINTDLKPLLENKVISTGEDINIGVFGSQDNTLYYKTDKIHLNDNGTRVVRNLILDAIQSYFI